MSSEPKDIPDPQAANNSVIAGSPLDSGHKFLIPSPVPTRRSRTYSASERALCGPTHRGKVKNFCRQQGHGFIIPDEGPFHHPIFVHISEVLIHPKILRIHGLVRKHGESKTKLMVDFDDDSPTRFCHCFGIDGEYVPKPGDDVTYKTVTIPPRNEKEQAVHVSITHLAPGVTHERWDAPVPAPSSPTFNKPQHID